MNACRTNRVKKLIIISTDKAAYPTNDMGKSKKRAEDLALKFNDKVKKPVTKISCVRFGNVLGSRGSVIPRFIKQINSKKSVFPHFFSLLNFQPFPKLVNPSYKIWICN